MFLFCSDATLPFRRFHLLRAEKHFWDTSEYKHEIISTAQDRGCWIEHRLVNQELCLPAQLSVNHTAALQLTLHPAAHQPSLMIKTLRHSSCVAWGSNSLPTRREPSTVLRQTTAASDSEVPTHPGSLKPSDLGPMKPTEPRRLPKARMHFTNRALLWFSPRLRLEILSQKE